MPTRTIGRYWPPFPPLLPSAFSAGGRAAGYAGTDAASDDDAGEGAVGASTGLCLLPHALADLSKVLGARLDPFALGPVSTIIAKELATLPQAGGQRSGGAVLPGQQDPGSTDSPRAGTAGSIGLVLIDRALDMATPCMHSEHVLDMVFTSLLRPAPAAPPQAVAAAAGMDAAAAAGAGPGQRQPAPWVSLR